ncbi:MAG: hypothetical protein ACI9Y1_003204 [Lentisphaeria bacterium]
MLFETTGTPMHTLDRHQFNRNKTVSAAQAVTLIRSGETLATAGFVGIGFAEELAITLEKRFIDTQHPQDLTLAYAAGQGDGGDRGLNHLAYEGLTQRPSSEDDGLKLRTESPAFRLKPTKLLHFELII